MNASGGEASASIKPGAPAEWKGSDRASPRGYFSVTALGEGKALIFGGEFYDNKRNLFYNDAFELDLASGSFRAPSFGPGSNLPPARSAHQACFHEGCLYVFGGESSAPNGQKFKLHDDLWRLVPCLLPARYLLLLCKCQSVTPLFQIRLYQSRMGARRCSRGACWKERTPYGAGWWQAGSLRR